MQIVDSLIDRLPKCQAWQHRVRVDHIYKDVLLEFCRIRNVPSLHDFLLEPCSDLFCSTESLKPCPEFFDVKRVTSHVALKVRRKYSVELRYTRSLVKADTLMSHLQRGSKISIIAVFSEAIQRKLVFEPLVMGFPWLYAEDTTSADKALWWNNTFFENFIEDIDEFKKVREIERFNDFGAMRKISEWGFKRALTTILGETASRDWGGERSDHYSAHIHLNGKRLCAAFLLKGPARFEPMGLNSLGKNNDQIVRLSHEPASLLVVQHCHDILPSVRETLRAFAVQPVNTRRYCLMDGSDSLRLLVAYGLYDEAVKWSLEK